MSAPELFTAAEIARCLDCTAQNIRKALGDIRRRPDGKKFVSGVNTAAWRFASLPAPLIVRLCEAAPKHGCETPIQFLQLAPGTPRGDEARPPLAHAHEDEIGRAQKLQRALSQALALPSDTPTAARARLAADDYRVEFGFSVSDRWLRGLIERTIKRDRGHGNFQRLDLYLSKRPALRKSKPSPLAIDSECAEHDEAFARVRDRNKPTIEEIAACWRAVVALYQERAQLGADALALKRQLRSYILQNAPFLGNTDAAVQKSLLRRIREATCAGSVSGITDRRLNPAPPTVSKKQAKDFPEDLDRLVDYTARFCYGRASQAWRELHTGTTANGMRFSAELRARWPFDVRRAKSQMPNQVRLAIKARQKRRLAEIRGSRAVQKIRPTFLLDWRTAASGDWFSMDDVTGNHYIYEFREDGKWECEAGLFNVGRAQFLLTIDERTCFPLGFAIGLEKRYDRMMIVEMAARIYLDPGVGLPRQGWGLEGGTFESNDVIESLSGWMAADPDFEDIAPRINRARTSEGKARIENTIGRLQTFFDHGKGFCGRGERNVNYQPARDFVSSLKKFDQPNKRPIHPGRKLMSLAEYEAALLAAKERFADEPQNGEWLRDSNLLGLSPREAWTQFASPQPPQVLSPSLAFKMAPAKTLQKVGPSGIVLRIGGWKHQFMASAELARLLDQKVLINYFPSTPDYVFVTTLSDPTGKRAFAVPRSERIPARGATSEQFAQRATEAEMFTNIGETRYTVCRPPTNLTICNTRLGSAEDHESGNAVNRVRQETAALDHRRSGVRPMVQQFAERAGIRVNVNASKTPEKDLENLKAAEEAKARARAREQAAAAQERETQ